MSLYVGHSDLGLGVFAARAFDRRERLLDLDGPLVDFAHTRRMGPDEAYPIQVGPDRYIDVTGLARYLNHSCDPNAGLQGLTLIALADIAPHDEVRFDYATTIFGDPWTMACRCRSPRCRGVVRDFRFLPASLRQRYIELGVAPPHAEEPRDHELLRRTSSRSR